MMNEKTVSVIGWIASFLSFAVFFSYIDQIRLNISGHPGSIILPTITVINCVTWSLYGLLKPKRDWPIVFCNVPGIVFGIVTAITAIRW